MAMAQLQPYGQPGSGPGVPVPLSLIGWWHAELSSKWAVCVEIKPWSDGHAGHSGCLSISRSALLLSPLGGASVSRVESELCLHDGVVPYVRAVLSAALPGCWEVVG
ncbi:Hypothetical protein SMAX5B_013118 [Scophthalmus maximus]|uniref:Uncharacterized protein n=1 Tax=Scophthalmus maximus TaxID=52904 RepID=A0A2U9BDN6_SCOMX|nr:Hypothetical protein SMAX5B_013118 [Scophthalmus maximus]